MAGDRQRPRRRSPQTVIATARSLSDSDLSLRRLGPGHARYMAPEQARGEVEPIDERADVFALGSILCEILTGQPAFTGARGVDIQPPGGRRRPERRLAAARRVRGRRRAGGPGPGLPGGGAGGPASRCGRGGGAIDGLPGRGPGEAAGRRGRPRRRIGPRRGGHPDGRGGPGTDEGRAPCAAADGGPGRGRRVPGRDRSAAARRGCSARAPCKPRPRCGSSTRPWTGPGNGRPRREPAPPPTRPTGRRPWPRPAAPRPCSSRAGPTRPCAAASPRRWRRSGVGGTRPRRSPID